MREYGRLSRDTVRSTHVSRSFSLTGPGELLFDLRPVTDPRFDFATGAFTKVSAQISLAACRVFVSTVSLALDAK